MLLIQLCHLFHVRSFCRDIYDGVARGYLNRPDLTNQVFMADPFKPSGRLYRTGDLARYGADGQIEFLGRTDDQVKIRGFRIELGEIETVLQQKTGIDDAVVLVHSFSSDEKEITAYFTGTMTEEEVRNLFNQELPAYMVPHHVMKLDAFTLTSNGKVDRKALPKPDEAHQELFHSVPCSKYLDQYRHRPEQPQSQALHFLLQQSYLLAK
ncbi:AMP-binding protein [Bacillus subtilis]|nr:AMP-binding protein [Bacillus subtilis]QHQ82228.1 AMP-binding protein [Bacillus subtilis]